MNLTPYVEMVRNGVIDATALADEQTQQVAQRLGGAVESTTRLALIRALSDAAGAVSADLAPTSVELRMVGTDPELVVRVPATSGTEPTMLLPSDEDARPVDDTDPLDEPVARISLRVPASVKIKVDQMADREGISTNAWLLRAVMESLGEPRSRVEGWPTPPPLPVPGLGPNGPFGPHGVFGPHGPFGPGGVFGKHQAKPAPDAHSRRGSVQGWVR